MKAVAGGVIMLSFLGALRGLPTAKHIGVRPIHLPAVVQMAVDDAIAAATNGEGHPGRGRQRG